MTGEEAIAIVQKLAEEKGWTWLEPAAARPGRRFWFFGRRLWHVHSNDGYRGCIVFAAVDAETGRILWAQFLPR